MLKTTQRSLVFCSVYKTKSGNQNYMRSDLQLLRSEDFFHSEPRIVLDSIIGFAVSENFLVAAQLSEPDHKDLILHVSTDGSNFARAVFPPGVSVTSRGYTGI